MIRADPSFIFFLPYQTMTKWVFFQVFKKKKVSGTVAHISFWMSFWVSCCFCHDLDDGFKGRISAYLRSSSIFPHSSIFSHSYLFPSSFKLRLEECTEY